jgi:hypothetical protein
MRIVDSERAIYVRQSWVGDYLICPERARLARALPSFRTGSDATAIGTGVHAAIEWAINSFPSADHIDRDGMIEYAQSSVAEELAKPIKLTRISDSPIEPTVDAMVNSWIDTIAIDMEWGGSTELGFRFPTGQLAMNGYEIWYEGTIDYVEPSGRLWDWKTAARSYSQSEKQKKAHQPTVYSQFMKRTERVTGDTQTFMYGVMIRQATPKGQVVEITRTESDYAWLNNQVQAMVNNALVVASMQWPMNDQHNLCSANWCDYWSVCKGAY